MPTTPHPVRFPTGRVVHLGQPGDLHPICGHGSTAKPQHTLAPASNGVTCRPCQEVIGKAS